MGFSLIPYGNVGQCFSPRLHWQWAEQSLEEKDILLYLVPHLQQIHTSQLKSLGLRCLWPRPAWKSSFYRKKLQGSQQP